MPELTPAITLAVLGAALLHASWNAMLKGGRDKMLDMAIVVAGSAVVVAPALPFLPLPAPQSWPYIAASMVIHVGYYTALVGTYRAGDLSHGYPLMRGVAPLLVAVFGAAVLGELPGAWMWLGILLISGGVIGIAFVGGSSLLHNWRATAWALTNAALIAAYTLVDGTGARLSGSSLSYVAWLLFLDGFPYVLIIAWLRRADVVPHLRRNWLRGLAGGGLSVAAYAIVLWAMTRAPIAAVAALRETSVIFAALLGSWLLKEPFGRARAAGTAAVLCGVLALRG